MKIKLLCNLKLKKNFNFLNTLYLNQPCSLFKNIFMCIYISPVEFPKDVNVSERSYENVGYFFGQ